MDFPALVYILCTLTCIACMALLLRGYLRSKTPLLLWTGVCFFFLFGNNLLLFLDKVVWPERTDLLGIEFPLLRALCAFLAVAVLLAGLIWESE